MRIVRPSVRSQKTRPFGTSSKVGEKIFHRTAIDQVWDYALDLKNFHEASHTAAIVPILIATKARQSASSDLSPAADKVYKPLLIPPHDLRATLEKTLRAIAPTPLDALDAHRWAGAPYRPTPTIIEAARATTAWTSSPLATWPSNEPCPASSRNENAPPRQKIPRPTR